MSNDDDEAVIILSVSLPAECNTPLDNMVANGAYGSTREEVARHFICSRLGVDPNAVPDLPEQAAEAAVEAAEESENDEQPSK